MAEDTLSKSRLKMSVYPTEEELAAWNAFNRDQQLAEMQADMKQAYESGVCELSMDEIEQEAMTELEAEQAESS